MFNSTTKLTLKNITKVLCYQLLAFSLFLYFCEFKLVYSYYCHYLKKKSSNKRKTKQINFKILERKKKNVNAHNYCQWIGVKKDLSVIEPNTIYFITFLSSFN